MTKKSAQSRSSRNLSKTKCCALRGNLHSQSETLHPAVHQEFAATPAAKDHNQPLAVATFAKSQRLSLPDEKIEENEPAIGFSASNHVLMCCLSFGDVSEKFLGGELFSARRTLAPLQYKGI